MEGSGNQERKVRRRLTDKESYLPFVPAQAAPAGMHLFWMPVSGFPMRQQEKSWTTEFLARFGAKLAANYQLRCEVFFEYKSISPELQDDFLRYAMHTSKLMGVGRRADQDLPPSATAEQIQEAVKDGKMLDLNKWMPDYLIWFMRKEPERQRELFLGHGGMMTIFLPPDARTTPPPLKITPKLRAALPAIDKMNLEGMMAGAFATRDGFLQRSKELFGIGLENRPEFPGYGFILPLLDSGHLLSATEDQARDWFSVFDIYVNESVKDQGLVVAFAKDAYDYLLLETLESMRDDDLAARQSQAESGIVSHKATGVPEAEACQ